MLKTIKKTTLVSYTVLEYKLSNTKYISQLRFDINRPCIHRGDPTQGDQYTSLNQEAGEQRKM